MDLSLSPQDEAFREEVRRFLDENLSEDLREAGRKTAGVFAEFEAGQRWHKVLAKRGWSAPSWPVGSFGKGVTPDAARAVDDEFKAVGAPGWGQDVSNLWANTVLAFGQDDLKRLVLRGLLLQQIPMCLLYSEPGAGSDLAAVQTLVNDSAFGEKLS